jgi:hypothetical protein
VDQVSLVSEVIGVDEDVLASTERSDESVPAYLIKPQNPTDSHDTHLLQHFTPAITAFAGSEVDASMMISPARRSQAQ